ncbi:MAG: DUF1963 domain-containing protein [Flavobacterium sp.]|nr:MAG: DUF1963 domain-containing protein [Flavobacterium sp.]
MIPPFLEKYKAEIEKYRLETVRITATPIEGSKTLPLTQSKFLGKPYLPLDQEYPKSKNGTPMILWAQINFDEVPKLENYPTTGIFQLFVSSHDWEDMDDYKILFHKEPTKQFQTDFSFLTEELYEERPINREHELTFMKAVEYGGTEDFRFKLDFDGKDYFDFQETLTEEAIEEMDKLFSATGHKIGGYAYFTQSDPRDYDANKKDDQLVLQIDTDDEIMFGDTGVMNIFLNDADLKCQNFTKAYFNWDCC